MFDGVVRFLKTDYGMERGFKAVNVSQRLPISSDYTGSALARLGVLDDRRSRSQNSTRQGMMVERVVLMPQGDCAAIVENLSTLITRSPAPRRGKLNRENSAFNIPP
jgi:hypothetical protein